MASPPLMTMWLCAALAVPWLPSGGLASSPSDDGCQRECGGVHIPFPFGTGPDHCMLPGFRINCTDDSGIGTRKAMLRRNIELLDISLERGEARVLMYISFYCYNTTSRRMEHSEWRWSMEGSPFTFSHAANKFTVVGCRTLAYIGDDQRDDAATYRTGCVAMCDDQRAALVDGSCSGMGCCQTAIPSGLQKFRVWFDRRINTSEINGVSPCSFAALMESSSFNFSSSYVTSLEFNNSLGGQAPLVLDWGIGDVGCEVAQTKPGYACVSNNSQCLNAAGGRGYICNCTQGYEGNPYYDDVTNGCKDIDECANRTAYGCFGDCTNTDGSFRCVCPAGTTGNPFFQNQCHKDPFPMTTRLAVGIVVCLLLFLIAFLATEVMLHKRSNKRQGYFEQHGGQMLLNFLKSDGNISFTFYDRGELLKATRNFSDAKRIGEGAHGAVYKAILSGSNDTTLAVKRCKQIDPSRKQEFVQELVILCRVNHPNVVRLLGCCLHFEAPMLVYEFLQNGTLDRLLHGRPKRRVMLATRLRISAETAEALAHLHSPPHPILHGDVKPENILLGDGWVAKVSDFGCSTIDDNIQVVPKGTLAYLDPEFLQDFQLTDKTDVYSFGVVLMELLTGKKPLPKQQTNLAIKFQEGMENGTLLDLLDTDVIKEGSSAMGVIHQAAELASRCTAVPGKERPAMGEVADELRKLSDLMPEGAEALQALEGHWYSSTANETETTGFYGIGSKAALSTELAR